MFVLCVIFTFWEKWYNLQSICQREDFWKNYQILGKMVKFAINLSTRGDFWKNYQILEKIIKFAINLSKGEIFGKIIKVWKKWSNLQSICQMGRFLKSKRRRDRIDFSQVLKYGGGCSPSPDTKTQPFICPAQNICQNICHISEYGGGWSPSPDTQTQPFICEIFVKYEGGRFFLPTDKPNLLFVRLRKVDFTFFALEKPSQEWKWSLKVEFCL